MVTNFDWRSMVKYICVCIIVLTAGVIAGSVYAGISGENTDTLVTYFNDVFGNMSMNSNSFKSIFIRWTILCAVISVSGTVLPGSIFNISTVGYRGFVTGYTTACFFRAYSLKGIFLGMSLLPEFIISLPVIIIFSSISLKMSFSKYENKKKLFGKYLLVCVIFFAIFCVISIFQAYLTTIFMRLCFGFLK